MSIRSHAASLGAVAGLALLFGASASGAIVPIDPFMEELPARQMEILGNPAQPVAALVITGSPGAILIDGVPAGDTDSTSQAGLATVLGGSRDALLESAGPGTAGLIDTVGINAGTMTASHSNGPNPSSKLTLTYDASGAGLSADLAGLGADAFGFGLASSDLDNRVPPVVAAIDITVTSGLGTPGQATETRSVLVSAEGDYTLDFAAYSSIDFSDVDVIEFFADYSSWDGVDVSYTGLYAVPAPGAAALLGLAGLAGARRRR